MLIEQAQPRSFNPFLGRRTFTRWILPLVVALTSTVANNQEVAANDDSSLTIGVFDYPPLITVTNGVIGGTAVEDLSKMLREAGSGYAAKFKTLPPKRLKQALIANNIDLAFPLYSDSIDDVSLLTPEPVLFEIPGLCFRKENFVPFLSTVKHWRFLNTVYPGGVEPVPILKKYGEQISPVFGEDVLDRTINLVASGRADAAYVANIFSVYNVNSKYYRHIACSSFFGFSSPVYIGVSKGLSSDTLEKLRQTKQRINLYSRD